MRQRLLTFVSFSATLGMASAQVVPRNIGIPGPGTPMPPLPSPTFGSSVNPGEPIISISGRQFSAEIIRETAHLTHDGTQITQRAPELMLARDSAGRVHVDGGRYYDFSLHDFRTTSYIYDPSARALYVPDATTKTACEISWSPSLNDSL